MLNHLIENEAAKMAFTKQSTVFDQTYGDNEIVQYKRMKIRNHFEKQLKSGSSILELNAGTGEDSIYLARQGHYVHATDVSEGMLRQLSQKIISAQLSDSVTYEQTSFLALENLTKSGPYDAIFSNFGGLNCTNQLDKVLHSFSTLVKSGGVVTLTIMPPFCLWEFLHVFRGYFKVAFRRLFAKKGAKAHIDGIHFLCWYYQPSYIIEHLKEEFELIELEGICTIVPPSYMETFPERYPMLWDFLKRAENSFNRFYPFNRIGDYYTITLKKRTA
ncbi:class I SAM-dependent methyltransferase [Spirosoma foliorum]|uniref:Class I SAM-dependent methyltransferase n=1 Tax=Spirosoma foliorum TaxID=2710596 RepID=A0A7G5H626_9BACT|nr:class I SAM-dependent methyltransferase [Spirosoma foliorum]QMW06568.1 class I SAM-dependent methyltransferase [Spirosoma foliorum]